MIKRLKKKITHLNKVFLLIFIFISSCNNSDNHRKQQSEEIKKHINIQNDSVRQLIRIDSFNAQLKKEQHKDSTGKQNKNQ